MKITIEELEKKLKEFEEWIENLEYTIEENTKEKIYKVTKEDKLKIKNFHNFMIAQYLIKGVTK